MSAITLELHVPDLDLATEFYKELGFDEAWRDDRPGKEYLVMRLGNTPLCFKLWTGEHGYFGKDSRPRGAGVEIVIAVDNIDETHERALSTRSIVSELQLRHWGARDFRARDPFGYYLRFTQPVDVLDPQYQGRPNGAAGA